MPGLAWRKENSRLMSRPRKYPQELLDRGARLVFESQRPVSRVAADLGISAETLRRHVRQVEIDTGRVTASAARSVRRSASCATRTSSCAARTRS
jgi:transposase-like protein